MLKENNAVSETPAVTRRITTGITCCWGISSAYVFFTSLVVTPNPGPCLAALILLVIVWATLQRKRWGRLALLGLSATLLTIYLVNRGFTLTLEAPWLLMLDRALANYTYLAPHFSEGKPIAAYILLGLVFASHIWLCYPSVSAEFERGKGPALAKAQYLIAMTLVGCWGIAVLLPPLLAAGKSQSLAMLLPPARSARSYSDGLVVSSAGQHISRRMVLSAAAESRR